MICQSIFKVGQCRIGESDDKSTQKLLSIWVPSDKSLIDLAIKLYAFKKACKRSEASMNQLQIIPNPENVRPQPFF